MDLINIYNIKFGYEKIVGGEICKEDELIAKCLSCEKWFTGREWNIKTEWETFSDSPFKNSDYRIITIEDVVRSEDWDCFYFCPDCGKENDPSKMCIKYKKEGKSHGFR